jgi:ribosome biogenesis GTPase / thiamine phosphate phosphatase
VINDYGWSETLHGQFMAHAATHQAEGRTAATLTPARIIIQRRDFYRIITAHGEADAQLSGRFRFTAEEGGHPVAGDWVCVLMAAGHGTASIQHRLPRRTAFVRKAAGHGQAAQVVAANIDIAMLVTSLNADLNLRRLERALAVAWESGATPVIVLTKMDLCDDPDPQIAQVEAIANGVRILPVSARAGQGLEALRALILPGTTAAVVGTSGVGKSTLVNALLGEERMATQAIRAADARGKHTTSHRELILLPGGGCILDTPGMREIGLWDVEEGLTTVFADIEDLATHCRFRDCTHTSEPGCAVQHALAEGSLEEARWHSYIKLQRETGHQERKENPLAMAEAKKRWARLNRQYRHGKQEPGDS